ncbi:hypothetical protein FRB99_002167 [Tulasnella sp. 403]|nr:hypothetical protein FRB99_002167 [Tulasnella sp. 403]
MFDDLQSSLLDLENRLSELLAQPKYLAVVLVVAPTVIVALNFLNRLSGNENDDNANINGDEPAAGSSDRTTTSTSIMSPPRENLAPPKTDPFTLLEISRFDGSNPSLPIYVSIKGTVFDVTSKRDVYGPPSGSYRVFAGKDASRAFGLSSLKAEDAVPDWSTLEQKEKKTLDEWFTFFRKRYNVVGRVTDMPESVRGFVWTPSEGGAR